MLACGAPPKAAPKGPPDGVRPPATPTALAGPALLPAHLVAELKDENASLYFARGNSSAVLLWGTNGRWQSRVIGPDGAPIGSDILDVAPMPDQVLYAALRPVGDGFVLVWAEAVAKNHAVKVLALDAKGQARGTIALITQSTDELSFLDLLPNTKGALVLWEVRRGERSDVIVAATDGAKAVTAPRRIAEGVLGWDAIPTDEGAALVTVVGGTDQDGSRALGRVFFTEVDDKGQPRTPSTVHSEPSAQIDVRIVRAGGRYLIAWTDERAIDANVYLAAVEPGGKVVVPPRRAMTPVGEQALVAIVRSSQGERALLAWEDLLKEASGGRRIHLATVSPDATLGADRATLMFSADGEQPYLVADGDGFAALTLAPAALAEGKAANQAAAEEAAPQEDPEIWPWPAFVRFGPDLRIRASEPIRAAMFSPPEKVPYTTRGLSCWNGPATAPSAPKPPPAQGGRSASGPATQCIVLAVGSAVPVPLAIVSLPIRPSPWQAPAFREEEEKAPRMASLSALANEEHISKIAATQVSESNASLVAWVTYFLEGSTGDGAPKKGKRDDDASAATLGVRPLAADGTPGKTQILSKKAQSMGGVAMAAAPARATTDGVKSAQNKQAEIAIAWVAREKGESQVYVTKVGADGVKIAQKKLTIVPRTKKKDGIVNDASDVAIAYAGGGEGNDGWIVAWSDTRDGNAEIYVAKVDRDLKKVIPDRRMTNAPGDSTEVQITVRGKDVILAWSDARQNVDDGNSDIYVARLNGQTLEKRGPESRLFASEEHSRTPSLVSSPMGLVTVWIEEPTGAGSARSPRQGSPRQPGGGKPDGGDGAGIRVALLDDTGMVVGAPNLIRGEGDAVTSATIACDKRCRGVLTSEVGETLMLGAFEFTPGAGAGPLKTLSALYGGTTQDVSPAFASSSGQSLFFADNTIGGSGRVRAMTIVW